MSKYYYIFIFLYIKIEYINNIDILMQSSMSTIKLNVGGQIFETTKETLSFSSYFKALLSNNWKQTDIIFIDRSAKLFEHILCLLRDPNYIFPNKYVSELDFYGFKANLKYSEWLEDLEAKIEFLIKDAKIDIVKCKCGKYEYRYKVYNYTKKKIMYSHTIKKSDNNAEITCHFD